MLTIDDVKAKFACATHDAAEVLRVQADAYERGVTGAEESEDDRADAMFVEVLVGADDEAVLAIARAAAREGREAAATAAGAVPSAPRPPEDPGDWLFQWTQEQARKGLGRGDIAFAVSKPRRSALERLRARREAQS